MKKYKYPWFKLAALRSKKFMRSGESILRVSRVSPIAALLRYGFCYFMFAIGCNNIAALPDSYIGMILLPFNYWYDDQNLLGPRLLFFAMAIPWTYQMFARKIIVTSQRVVLMNLLTGKYKDYSPTRYHLSCTNGIFGLLLGYRHILEYADSGRVIKIKGVLNVGALNRAISNSRPYKYDGSSKRAFFSGAKDIFYIGNHYESNSIDMSYFLKRDILRQENKKESNNSALWWIYSKMPRLFSIIEVLYVLLYISPGKWETCIKAIRSTYYERVATTRRKQIKSKNRVEVRVLYDEDKARDEARDNTEDNSEGLSVYGACEAYDTCDTAYNDAGDNNGLIRNSNDSNNSNKSNDYNDINDTNGDNSNGGNNNSNGNNNSSHNGSFDNDSKHNDSSNSKFKRNDFDNSDNHDGDDFGEGSEAGQNFCDDSGSLKKKNPKKEITSHDISDPDVSECLQQHFKDENRKKSRAFRAFNEQTSAKENVIHIDFKK